MRKEMKLFFVRSLVPLIGCLFVCYSFSEKVLTMCLVYLFIIIPLWLLINSAKIILISNWRITFAIFLLISFMGYLYGFTWPIAGWLVGAADIKMGFLIVLIIEAIINAIMIVLLVFLKLIYNHFKHCRG